MPKPEHQVLVCTNTRPPGNPKGSCGEKGSDALADQLKALGHDDYANVANLIGYSYRKLGDYKLSQVTPGDLDEICRRHLEEGQVLERLFMPDIPWE